MSPPLIASGPALEMSASRETSAAHDLAQGIEIILEPGQLAGLHKAQMPVGNDQAAAPENGAKDRQADALDRRADEALMAQACDAIEDYACKPDVVTVGPAAERDRRRRFRLG